MVRDSMKTGLKIAVSVLALAGLVATTAARADNEYKGYTLRVKLIGGVPGFLSEANGPTHQAIEDLRRDWRSLWLVHGPAESGWAAYRRLISDLDGRHALVGIYKEPFPVQRYHLNGHRRRFGCQFCRRIELMRLSGR